MRVPKRVSGLYRIRISRQCD